MVRLVEAHCVAWLILMMGLATASAQEIAGVAPSDSPPVAARLAELESEVAALKSRLDRPGDPGVVSLDTVSAGGFYAGFEFVFAKPHYKESFEATLVTPATGTVDLMPFAFDYEVSPRVWLGYEGSEGVGVRASYWQYDHSAHPVAMTPALGNAATAQAVTVIFPATITAALPGDTLTANNRLQLQTIDLEGTSRVHIGEIALLGGAGIRYARMDQSTTAAVTNSGVVTQQLNWSRRFEGVGPTFSAELRRPLGSWGLDFVSNARGAILFGNKDLSRFVSPGSLSTPPVVSLHDASDVSGMGLAGLGIEWNRHLHRYGTTFVRGTYEGQLWTDAGSPTLTFLGFEGFTLALGLSR